MPNFRTIKISRKRRLSQSKFGSTSFAELRGRAYAGTITISRLLNTPKESLLNQVTPKNACQNFPTPKKSPNGKFETPQKSFDYPCHLKSGVPPLEFIPSLSLSIHRSDRVWIEFYTGFTKTSELFSWEGDTRLVLAEQGVVTVKPGQAFPSLTN